MAMSELGKSRLSHTAVAAFLLGLASPLLSLVAALPALYLGVRAMRAINSSEGQLRGRRLAIAGLVLGGITTLLSVLGFAALLLLYAQDKSYLAGCSNNLRLLGQAVNRYSDHDNGHFPSATVPNASLAPEQRLSWEAAILPYLAEGTPAGKKWGVLAGEIDFKEAWDAPANAGPRPKNVAPFLCPAFVRGLPPEQKGLSAYVGMAGVGSDAAAFPLTDPHTGFFGYDRRPTRADISAGISNTMMVVETASANGPWLAGVAPTVRGLDPDCERYIGRGRPFGGLHREGLNVLWADGSARPVNEGVAVDAFRASARIARENAK
jgi:prepilin-type processing-associated H-X9-DG protein